MKFFLDATTNVMVDICVKKTSKNTVFVCICRERDERVIDHRRVVPVVHLGVMYRIEKQFRYEA